MLTELGESSTGSRRTVPLRGSCAAIVGLVQISGWLSKGLSFYVLLNSLALCSWQMGAWQTARVAPAERGENGIRDLPRDFHRSPTRGQGDFQPPKVRRVAVGDYPGFIGTDSEQPPYLSQLARTCKFGAWRSFLLDRPRPVFFSARSKRKWGVDCQAIIMAHAPSHRTHPF